MSPNETDPGYDEGKVDWSYMYSIYFSANGSPTTENCCKFASLKYLDVYRSENVTTS